MPDLPSAPSAAGAAVDWQRNEHHTVGREHSILLQPALIQSPNSPQTAAAGAANQSLPESRAAYVVCTAIGSTNGLKLLMDLSNSHWILQRVADFNGKPDPAQAGSATAVTLSELECPSGVGLRLSS